MQILTVRAATPTDIPALAHLWYEKSVLLQQADSRVTVAADGRARWEAAARGWLDDPQTALLVADNGSLIGYVVGQIQPNTPGLLPERTGVVADIALDAHAYHAGAGRGLVAALRVWFSGQGVEQIIVRVSRRHAVEQAFWRALGAKTWFDCLWMKC